MKILLTERVGVRVDQIRLLSTRKFMENGQTLAYYNVNNHSIFLIVERLRGEARSKHIVLSRVKPLTLLNAADSKNPGSLFSENSDTFEVNSDTSEENVDLTEEK